LKPDYIAIPSGACGYNKTMKSQRMGATADLSSLYDEDFFEWTQRSAEMLRAGQFDLENIGNIAQEIEDMGKRDLRELNSRVQVLLFHLLKWQLQPEKRSRSWKATITTQRVRMDDLLVQSPSLRPKFQANLELNYTKAVHIAGDQTGLAPDRFPSHCPFTLAQVLDPEFLP
jgi:Domain of unknown function DUF29